MFLLGELPNVFRLKLQSWKQLHLHFLHTNKRVRSRRNSKSLIFQKRNFISAVKLNLIKKQCARLAVPYQLSTCFLFLDSIQNQRIHHLHSSVSLWPSHVFILFNVQDQSETTLGTCEHNMSLLLSKRKCIQKCFVAYKTFFPKHSNLTSICHFLYWMFAIECVTHTKTGYYCCKIFLEIAWFTFPCTSVKSHQVESEQKDIYGQFLNTLGLKKVINLAIKSSFWWAADKTNSVVFAGNSDWSSTKSATDCFVQKVKQRKHLQKKWQKKELKISLTLYIGWLVNFV